jgi:hypothetical protein
MRTRPAVAVTVLAALAGAAGIVVEAAFGIPAPTRLGLAQPLVWALAGLLPLLAAGTALSLRRPAKRVPRLLLAMATALGTAGSRLYAADPRRERVSGYDLLSQFGTTLGHACRLGGLAPPMAAALVRGLGLAWARLSLCLPGTDRIVAARVGPPDGACLQTGACGRGSPLALGIITIFWGGRLPSEVTRA